MRDSDEGCFLKAAVSSENEKRILIINVPHDSDVVPYDVNHLSIVSNGKM
jgi:hypothetical protein